MPSIDRLVQNLKNPSTKTLQRAVWLTAAAVAIVLAAFIGYYVWDRYIHLGDKSPLELNIEHIEQAVRDDPENPDARVALAETYLTAGQYEQALDQANQVLALYPDNDKALLIAGIAHVRLNQPQAAIEPLERFTTLRQDLPMAQSDMALEAAYYFLGESYVKLERYADAIPALEAALRISATDADALYQLGLAYQDSGQPEAALEQYQKAVRLVPNFAEAYQAMGQSYTALGKPDYATYAQGMEAFSHKDYETAARHLEQATRALPDFAPAFLGLGLTYERMGRLDEALAAIEQAMALDADDFATQQALGRIRTILKTED